MINKATCLLLFLLLGALRVAHADTVVDQFTVVGEAPSFQSPNYNIATFQLPSGEMPGTVSSPPQPEMIYYGVMVDYSFSVGGVVVSSVDAPATVMFDSDGVQVESEATSGPDEFNFFAGSGEFWSDNNHDPMFEVGNFPSYDEIGDYVDVSTESVVTPEPPAFALLGTGLLWAAALGYRKLWV